MHDIITCTFIIVVSSNLLGTNFGTKLKRDFVFIKQKDDYTTRKVFLMATIKCIGGNNLFKCFVTSFSIIFYMTHS